MIFIVVVGLWGAYSLLVRPFKGVIDQIVDVISDFILVGTASTMFYFIINEYTEKYNVSDKAFRRKRFGK